MHVCDHDKFHDTNHESHAYGGICEHCIILLLRIFLQSSVMKRHKSQMRAFVVVLIFAPDRARQKEIQDRARQKEIKTSTPKDRMF